MSHTTQLIPTVCQMRRGDIFYADLSPAVGSEINKRRPVLIVSNDANNRASSTVTVLPITSNVSRVFPFEVLLPTKKSGLAKDSKAMAQQIRTVSKERLILQRAGGLDGTLMRAVDAAIRLHLALS
jgi:mRNA interferase MazF